MENEFETQDSIPEGDQDTNLENESLDTSDELAKAREYAQNQKIRAEKAERELKAIRSKSTETETPKKEEEQKSNESDYSEKIDKLTLKSEGITNPDAQKIVLEEAKRLKLPVDEIVQLDYMKSKLKDFNDQLEAQSGMPKGKGRSGGSNSQDVDYWVGQKNADGTFKTPTDVGLAEKVINARIHQEEAANKFSDVMFTG